MLHAITRYAVYASHYYTVCCICFTLLHGMLYMLHTISLYTIYVSHYYTVFYKYSHHYTVFDVLHTITTYSWYVFTPLHCTLHVLHTIIWWYKFTSHPYAVCCMFFTTLHYTQSKEVLFLWMCCNMLLSIIPFEGDSVPPRRLAAQWSLPTPQALLSKDKMLWHHHVTCPLICFFKQHHTGLLPRLMLMIKVAVWIVHWRKFPTSESVCNKVKAIYFVSTHPTLMAYVIFQQQICTAISVSISSRWSLVVNSEELCCWCLFRIREPISVRWSFTVNSEERCYWCLIECR